MKTPILLLTAAFLCIFPATTVGKYWPKPSEIFQNEMILNTDRRFNYGDSKIWKCTYRKGSDPAISISPSIPSNPFPSPPNPKTSPAPSKPPSPPHSRPKKSPSLTPSKPKKSPSPHPSKPKNSPSPTHSKPKKSPFPHTSKPKKSSTPTPSKPKKSPSSHPSKPEKSPTPTPSKPNKSPFPHPSKPKKSPSLRPSTPKKSPFTSPSTPKTTPLFPPPKHNDENPLEHIDNCMGNMVSAGICMMEMEMSYDTGMFGVSNYCCNLLKNMRNECDDVVWGFFSDPFFVPLVRYTCHVNY